MYITKCLDLFTRKERKMKGRNEGRKGRGRRGTGRKERGREQLEVMKTRDRIVLYTTHIARNLNRFYLIARAVT